MQEPKLYKDPEWKGMERVFLEDEVYSEALRAFVVVCVDVVVVDREKKLLYLAKRMSKPASNSWWWIGGRVMAGEAARDAAVRAFKRETSVTLNPDELQFLRFCRNWFPDRQQDPQDAGTDGLVHLYAIELDEATRDVVAQNLDKNEYDPSEGLVAFDREKLVAEGVREQVLDAYDALFCDE